MSVTAPEIHAPLEGISTGQPVPAAAVSHLLRSAGWARTAGAMNLGIAILAGVGALGSLALPAGSSSPHVRLVLLLFGALALPTGLLMLSYARRVRALRADGAGDRIAEVFRSSRRLWTLLALLYAATLLMGVVQIVLGLIG